MQGHELHERIIHFSCAWKWIYSNTITCRCVYSGTCLFTLLHMLFWVA